MKISATTVMIMSKNRCPASTPKAAPVFLSCRRLKKPGIIGMISVTCVICVCTSRLVPQSSIKTGKATQIKGITFCHVFVLGGWVVFILICFPFRFCIVILYVGRHRTICGEMREIVPVFLKNTMVSIYTVYRSESIKLFG